VYTRVKICGITREQDAMACVSHGVDAIGLVFYSRSPRYIDVERARRICRALPAFVTTVALFKDADIAQIEQVIDRLQVDLLQFHGSETAGFCEQFSRPYIKALGVAGERDLEARIADYALSRGILLDSHAPGDAGGTGQAFDWQAIPDSLQGRLILAGGLHAGNVGQAIKIAQPYAVDASSGVEQSAGIKDAGKIRAFMQQVRTMRGESVELVSQFDIRSIEDQTDNE